LDTNNLNIKAANLVMVFDNLNQARISRDTLLRLFPKSAQGHVDIGSFFAVRYPEHSFEVLIFSDERRVELKVAKPIEESWNLIPRIASQVRNAIKNANLKAYGFNLFMDLKLDESSSKFILHQFNSSLVPIEKSIGEEISSISITMNYTKGDVKFQWVISPKANDDKVISISSNVHFDANKLPLKDDLIATYDSKKKYIIETIGQLFEG
jgi:hypothetical protein